MPINEQALEKLKAATFTATTFANVMAQMCEARDLLGAGDTQLTLDYQSEDTVVKPGDMIPVITIGLRQGVVVDSIETEIKGS